MNTNITLVAAKALPALSGSTLTYNAEKNLFLTVGYTSAAGNTYFDAIRLSDRIAVYCSIGQGYFYTFLNAIKVFCWDGIKPRLIGQRSFGGFGNWVCFSESFVRQKTIEIVKDFLHGQTKLAGQVVSEPQLSRFTEQLVDDLHKPKRLC